MSANSADINAKLGAVLDAYVPMRTEPALLLPANDYFDLAGEEFGRRLMLTVGVDGANYCLRPDFTLPIAQDFMANVGRGSRAYGYSGKVFRQRTSGPAEFTQMGLELLDQEDAVAALDKVFRFVVDSCEAAELSKLHLTMGSVAMFETVLRGANIPQVWLPRLRHRFGNPKALNALLDRLENQSGTDGAKPLDRDELLIRITDTMLTDGLSLTEGRTPDEIADRFIEKQELASARVDAGALQFLRQYLAILGPIADAMRQAERLCADHNIDVSAELSDVLTHKNMLDDFAPELQLDFSTGFAPRLHYYTGLVFKVQTSDGLTLASGGQYDRLLKSLGAQDAISAVGVAIWVERMTEANNG